MGHLDSRGGGTRDAELCSIPPASPLESTGTYPISTSYGVLYVVQGGSYEGTHLLRGRRQAVGTAVLGYLHVGGSIVHNLMAVPPTENRWPRLSGRRTGSELLQT